MEPWWNMVGKLGKTWLNLTDPKLLNRVYEKEADFGCFLHGMEYME